MPQHRLLELAKPWTGLDAELVDERWRACPVRLERLGLPARPVEREHQQSARALAQRVLRHERLRFAPTASAWRPHASSASRRRSRASSAQLVEPRRHLLEDTAPRPGRRAPGRARARAPRPSSSAASASRPVLEGDAAVVRQPLELLQVERVGLDAEDVPGAAGLDRILAERLAEVRDVPLDEIRGRRRWLVGPQLVDEPRAGTRVFACASSAASTARWRGAPRLTARPSTCASSGPSSR